MNQLGEQWLREEADQRVHGTLKEVVAERFAQEAPHLQPLPTLRFDTSYVETRIVSWDAYIEVRGNRYSVPGTLAGQVVRVRIGLDGQLRVYHDEQMITEHRMQDRAQGWVTVPDHHAELWHLALGTAAVQAVEARPLTVYEEAASWT
jgi:hypothetical protein